MKILRTASIGSNFTGSYKKWCSISGQVDYEGVAEAFVKLFAQSIKFYTIHSIITFKEHGCLKKVIHQIDKKNEWLLLSTSFTAKFELVFLKNDFSWRFHFKTIERASVVASSKKRY